MSWVQFPVSDLKIGPLEEKLQGLIFTTFDENGQNDGIFTNTGPVYYDMCTFTTINTKMSCTMTLVSYFCYGSYHIV